MPKRTIILAMAAGIFIFLAAAPVQAYVAYETHLVFLNQVTEDLMKLMPRAMGKFIFLNRYDFFRGLTFVTRDVRNTIYKNKDIEEIRRDSYARLSRDIPYCVEALKGGEFKLDTSSGNVAGRMGMVAYSIMLRKMPDFPDVKYLERFTRIFDQIIGENLIDVWVYYDGYGDFHSLGELMERFKDGVTPDFRHVRNDKFPVEYREDIFAMFRFPRRFIPQMILDDAHINFMYNEMINDILDAYIYIWKCSGMELAHPSYTAPPGTIISKPTRRKVVTGGTLQAMMQTAQEREEEELPEAMEEEAPEETPPPPAQPSRR
jgi:hypothetical protein